MTAATLTRPEAPPSAENSDDDGAWVTDSLTSLPCGARRIPPGYAAAVGYSPAPAGQAWFDVTVLGQHLPLPYAARDVGVLTAMICPDLGLCPDCLGAGDLAGFPPLAGADPADLAAFLARAPGQCTVPCPRCGGTGRPALRIRPAHYGGRSAWRVTFLDHRYIPPLPGLPPPSLPVPAALGDPGRWCLACGQAGTRRSNCRA